MTTEREVVKKKYLPINSLSLWARKEAIINKQVKKHCWSQTTEP